MGSHLAAATLNQAALARGQATAAAALALYGLYRRGAPRRELVL